MNTETNYRNNDNDNNKDDGKWTVDYINYNNIENSLHISNESEFISDIKDEKYKCEQLFYWREEDDIFDEWGREKVTVPIVTPNEKVQKKSKFGTFNNRKRNQDIQYSSWNDRGKTSSTIKTLNDKNHLQSSNIICTPDSSRSNRNPIKDLIPPPANYNYEGIEIDGFERIAFPVFSKKFYDKETKLSALRKSNDIPNLIQKSRVLNIESDSQPKATFRNDTNLKEKNIIDSSTLKRLSKDLLERNKMTMTSDAAEFLSQAMQIMIKSHLESAISNSKNRSNASLAIVEDKILNNPQTRVNFGIKLGPDNNNYLREEEKQARTIYQENNQLLSLSLMEESKRDFTERKKLYKCDTMKRVYDETCGDDSDFIDLSELLLKRDLELNPIRGDDTTTTTTVDQFSYTKLNRNNNSSIKTSNNNNNNNNNNNVLISSNKLFVKKAKIINEEDVKLVYNRSFSKYY